MQKRFSNISVKGTNTKKTAFETKHFGYFIKMIKYINTRLNWDYIVKPEF